MHIVYQTLNQLFQAALVYVFLIFGYSNVSDAAYCGGFNTYYVSTTNAGANTNLASFFNPTVSGSDPSGCTIAMLTGDDYTNLIKNRIDTANINITTLQGNTQTLQNNIQTVNNSLQTVAELAADSRTRIEALEAQFQTQGLRDSDNILHINHDDSLTLFYAVMGLFAIAFVWRFARNSLNVADNYAPAE